MNKLLLNIHWFIIVWALYNIGTYYQETEEKISGVVIQQEKILAEIKKSKKIKKEIEVFSKNIDEAKGRIERVASEIEKNQQLLPSEFSDTTNINLLRNLAEDVNIHELNIVPGAEKDNGFYISKEYKFSAKATYLQLLIVLEKIGESKRILNISNITLKSYDQHQRSKFQLIDGEFTLETYRYNPAFKEDRGIESIEKNFKEGKPVIIPSTPKPQKALKVNNEE